MSADPHQLQQVLVNLARVAFLTGDQLSAAAGDFLRESGAPSLPKPFRLDELATLLQRLCARS